MNTTMSSLFTVHGRMNRLPFVLLNLGMTGLLILVSLLIEPYMNSRSPVILVPYLAFYLAIVVFGVILAVRRAHDIDLSGWFVLIELIPVVGLIFALYLAFKKGTPGANRFGPNPLESPDAVTLPA